MNKQRKIEDEAENYRTQLYDKELEEICRNSRIMCLIHTIFPHGKARKPEKYLEQYYNYLSDYTGNNYNSKFEFDTVKYYANKYNFNYDKIIQAYTENLCPAGAYAGLDSRTIHNLFIALMEYFAFSKATDNIAENTIEELSTMMGAQKFAPDKYLQKTTYRLPDFISELNYVYDRSDVAARDIPDEFYADFADRLHYKYSNEADEMHNIFVQNRKEKENAKYYELTDENLLDGALDFMLRDWRDFIKPIIKDLLNKLNELIHKNSEAKNSYRYTYDPFNTDFVPQEIIKKLECTIEKTVPYWRADWINCFSHPELDKFIRWHDVFAEPAPEIDTSPQNYDLQDTIATDVISGEQINAEYIDLSHLKNYPADFNLGVREVLMDVLDDYNSLKGFK